MSGPIPAGPAGAMVTVSPSATAATAAPALPRGAERVRPRPPRAPLPALHAVAITALLTVSGLALWGLLYAYALSSVQEHRSQHELHDTFERQLAEGTAPVDGAIAPGSPVAVMRIPRIGVRNLVVVEGTTSADLEAGPGHRRDTPLPGQRGTSFILGRSRTFGAPFGGVSRLRKGNPIIVQTGEGELTFLVTAVRRPGRPLTAVDPGATALTLVTSEGTRGHARQAIYVDAVLSKGDAQPASTGRPTSLPMAERQMSGDRSAFTSVVLWLQGLVLVLVAITWTQGRWGRRPTLLVGVPVVLAAVWGVTETLTQLLPNLF